MGVKHSCSQIQSWNHVKTFDECIYMMNKYLTGRIWYSPWFNRRLQSRTIEIAFILLDILEKGFLCILGKPGSVLEYQNEIIHQRGYLMGFVQKKDVPKVTKVEILHMYSVCVVEPNGKIQKDHIPSVCEDNKVITTRLYDKKIRMWQDTSYIELPHIPRMVREYTSKVPHSVLQGTMFVWIVAKDWGKINLEKDLFQVL